MDIRKDLLEASKTVAEGGTGLAQKFWAWNEEQIKPYLWVGQMKTSRSLIVDGPVSFHLYIYIATLELINHFLPPNTLIIDK